MYILLLGSVGYTLNSHSTYTFCADAFANMLEMYRHIPIHLPLLHFTEGKIHENIKRQTTGTYIGSTKSYIG